VVARSDSQPAHSLTTVLAEARASWPGVLVDGEAFAEYLQRRGALPPDEGVAVSDLYLACACASGDARAIAELDRRFVTPLADVVARAGFPPDVGVEVAQRLRTQLLVGDAEHPPRITSYSGRAALVAWLRVVAIREAGKIRRHEDVHRGLRPDPQPPMMTPEDEAIRARYGTVFETAFADAFRALPADDRLALRLHFTEGLNLDGLAVTFGFSRATAGRRLLEARGRLRSETMRIVGEQLGATGSEVESVLKVLQTALELSFGALVTSA
jgi:RNA polymerase sigma-70 factor (ECF subfamily)